MEGETTASSDAAVVLNGGTSDNWAELVDWTRSKGSSLRETSLTTSVFPAGLNRDVSWPGSSRSITRNSLWYISYLVEMYSDTSVPVLVEVCSKQHELEMVLQYCPVAFPVVCPIRVIIPPLPQNTLVCHALPIHLVFSLLSSSQLALIQRDGNSRFFGITWLCLIAYIRKSPGQLPLSIISNCDLHSSYVAARAQHTQHINVHSEESEERTYHCVGR